MTWLGIRLVKEKDAQIAISDKQFQQTLTQITRQNFYIRFKWAFGLAELVYKQNQRKGIGDIITQNHERRLKIISFRQIQRNAPIQKELRRIKAIQDFTLKQKYFDLFKYFSSITREERYNWAKAGRFYEFLCKRRGLYAIRDFYDKNYVPHEVEDQQMEKAGNLHRFKFMQSIFLKFYVVINQQKIERLNDLKADSFYTKKRLQMLVKGIYNSRKKYTKIILKNEKKSSNQSIKKISR